MMIDNGGSLDQLPELSYLSQAAAPYFGAAAFLSATAVGDVRVLLRVSQLQQGLYLDAGGNVAGSQAKFFSGCEKISEYATSTSLNLTLFSNPFWKTKARH